MSRRIAVRLPDDLAEFVDQVVQRGDAPSRDSVVSHALRHERRRVVAASDAAILSRAGADADFDALSAHAAALPMGGLGPEV